jgi:3-dehydroquinate dehydratase/shikimate dehydrogenase
VLKTLAARVNIRQSRVLIVGAGGAARAVAFALSREGASVCIWARRQKRARAIAQAVGGTLVDRSSLRSEFFDAIVNATPVGMHPFLDDSPLEARDLNCKLVFDTIYRPRMTKLLQLAKRQGIETVSGVEMFVAQGVAQWEIWTGKRAPVAQMRRAVLTALRREENAQDER